MDEDNNSIKRIKKIARRVKEQRSSSGKSQRELADNINVKKDVIQRIESGNLKSIKPERLQQIAYFLDCSADYLCLSSDDPRNQHMSEPRHFTLPEFQHTAEGFIYKHLPFREDIAYMSKFMHPDIQNQILKTVHVMVTLHKCGVHFPNTTPESASSIGYNEINTSIKKNFFDSLDKEKSKWTYQSHAKNPKK